MSIEFRLPDLGENIESGEIVKILVAKGDQIAKHQALLELETDKAVIEVPSSVEGVVEQLHVKEGDNVKVGQTVLTLAAKSSEEAPRPPAVDSEAPAKRTKTVPKSEVSPGKKAQPVPLESASSAEDTVSADDKGAVVEFVRARKAGPAPTEKDLVPAAPSVRRFARQIGVDIRLVEGSGPRGRISTDDVKAHARDQNQSQGQPSAPPLPDFSQWGETEKVAFSNVRRKTAQHMANAWSTVPHVTQSDKADITELEQARKRFARGVEESGGKLTVTAVLLKVLASGLKVFPQFNASIDAQNQEIILKRYCHIGVAVDTDRGLLVPVIRDVDQKNILVLSLELTQAAEKARLAKLGLEEMQGGCFTVTNLGGIGGTYFSPIVNWPEVAILGVSRGRVEPVHRDGEFVPRLLLPLSLSYDHRIIDGADAIRFLRWICRALEDPFLLALEG